MTKTNNVTSVTFKNKRLMKWWECVTCSSTITQFIKGNATGGSFLKSAINKLPVELHLLGHNFTEPGTKLDKWLNADGTPNDWSIPINRVDNAAHHLHYHQLCYSKHDDTKLGMKFVIRQCWMSWMVLWTQLQVRKSCSKDNTGIINMLTVIYI